MEHSTDEAVLIVPFPLATRTLRYGNLEYIVAIVLYLKVTQYQV